MVGGTDGGDSVCFVCQRGGIERERVGVSQGVKLDIGFLSLFLVFEVACLSGKAY